MSSRHLVDPELLAGIDMFPVFTMDPETLVAMRAARLKMAGAVSAPDPTGLLIENVTIDGPDGDPLPLIVFRPTGAAKPMPAMLQIHGGGYVLGEAGASRVGNAETALAADCVVVSVDYRLAPETPFPGPLEDCYAALRWLYARCAEFGVDSARIAVAGDSAGGGLAAALAVLARDRGEVPLCFQRLGCPMIDDRTCNADRAAHVGEFVWTRASNYFGWKSFLGAEPGGAGVSPLAAVARVEDLSGLPPAFISVGSLDLFLDEDIDYARRLLAAGVPTELHVYPGAYHGFEMSPASRLAARAADDRLAALRRAFAR